MDKKILVLSLIAAGNVFGMDEGNFSPYRASPVFFNQQQMRSVGPTCSEYSLEPCLQIPSMRHLGYSNEVYDIVYYAALDAYKGREFCYGEVIDIAQRILEIDAKNDWSLDFGASSIYAENDALEDEGEYVGSTEKLKLFSTMLSKAILQVRKTMC